MDTMSDQSAPVTPRPGAQHREVVREAGFSRVSILSIIAGTLAAIGAFALLSAIVGAVLASSRVKPALATDEWTNDSVISIVSTAVVLFIAFLFGGYVAGRMARRSGLVHGIATFLLGLLVVAVTGGIVGAVADRRDVNRNLRSIGLPIDIDDWNIVLTVALIATVGAMAVGAVLGGLLGERWHTKLARRALDPDYGPDADSRRQAATERLENEQAERDRADRDRAELQRAERGRLDRERDEQERTRVEAAAQDDDEESADGRRVVVAGPDRGLEGSGSQDQPGAAGTEGSTALTDRTRDERSTERLADYPDSSGDGERLSASEWAQANRGDEPRLSAAEWAEIERLQAARRNPR